MLLLVVLAVPFRMFGQCPLTLQVSHTPVQQLSVSDIDFEHFQSTSLLFTLVIGNTSATPANAILQISIDVNLADGSNYTPAVTYKSLPFAVNAGGQTFTNLDIGSGATKIKTGSFDYNSDAKARLNDIVLGTGRFPAGKYTFSVRVTCEDGTGAKDDHFVVILQNASHMELRAPVDGERTNQFPLFEYYTDASEAELTVAELTPGQSRQDAIDQYTPMVNVTLENQNSFFYAGGRPLEVGKSYVWQVVGKSRVSGGSSVDIKSEIRKFTVASGGMTDDELLRQIEEILGPKYKSVFDQIRSGQLKLTGLYTNNNSPISQGELLNLVNELRDALDSAEVVLE